jgi:hypothetical protein
MLMSCLWCFFAYAGMYLHLLLLLLHEVQPAAAAPLADVALLLQCQFDMESGALFECCFHHNLL